MNELAYVPDRAPHQLTAHPMMRRAQPAPVARDSIFGDTYGGVPNPLVSVEHGYPTRYHGPNFNVPQPGYRYIERPYAKSSPAPGFWGFEDRVGGLSASMTGNRVYDAVLGALVGYAAAPSRDAALTYVAAGALSAGFLGMLGMAGLLGFSVYKAQEQGGLRRDLRGIG